MCVLISLKPYHQDVLSILWSFDSLMDEMTYSQNSFYLHL